MAENENAFLDEEEGIIELEDENGEVTRFEFIDAMEVEGVTYYALVPESEDDEAADIFVVLKEIESEEGALLVTVDDDEEYNKVGEMFMERFAQLAAYEDEDGENGEILQ